MAKESVWPSTHLGLWLNDDDDETITIIPFRCNKGMDNALSISLHKIFSDPANRMKRMQKSVTDVVDMGNKGEVRIKRDSKVFDNTIRLSVMITDFN